MVTRRTKIYDMQQRHKYMTSDWLSSDDWSRKKKFILEMI